MTESRTSLLRRTSVRVAPETFSILSLTQDHWKRLLENAETSPRMTAPFMILMDKDEVTLVLDDTDFDAMRPALRDTKSERGFRMLTFDQVLDFSVVGFLAEISRILADSGISIFALSSFSREHLLVKQTDLARALKALGPHVEDLC